MGLDLPSLSVRYTSSMPTDRAQSWSELADAILSSPTDLGEIQTLLAIAARVLVCGAHVAANIQKEKPPGDDELIRPEKLAAETGLSLHCIREAIRRKKLATFPKGASRNVKVRRGDGKKMAGVVV